MLWQVEIGYEEQFAPDLYDVRWIPLRVVVVDFETRAEAEAFGVKAAAATAETAVGRDGEEIEADVFAQITNLGQLVSDRRREGDKLIEALKEEEV